MLGSGGGIFLRRNRHGTLVSAVLLTKNALEDWGSSAKWDIEILSEPGDKKSLAWAKTVLKEQCAVFEESCDCALKAWQLSLLPWFENRGICIRSVLLNGDVKKSLRRLRSHYGKRLSDPFDRAGLELRPARTAGEVKKYLRILQKEYGRNPQFGAFVANPKFLKFLGKRVLQEMRRSKKPLWVVYQKHKLIGGVDIVEFSKGFEGKTRAGFGVNLAAEAQGKGFSRAIYEKILTDLKARGIEMYFGSTGQPGVMRLGKIMGRWLAGVEVDRGVAKAFPRKHFNEWI